MADRETGATLDFLCSDLAFKGLHTSAVAAVVDIGRLDGCSSTSGELGTSSFGELDGDIARCVKKAIWTGFDGAYGPRTQSDGDFGRGPLLLIANNSNPGRALHCLVLEKDTASYCPSKS